MKSFKQYLMEDRWYDEYWMEDNLKQLKHDEGFRGSAYQNWIVDPKTGGKKLDKVTIGYGANLNDPATQKTMKSVGLDPEKYLKGATMSEVEAEMLLRQQQGTAISDAYKQIPQLKDKDMPDAARNVATNLSFQLGMNKLGEFKNFKKALGNKDFNTAADELGRGSRPGTESGLMQQAGNRTMRHQFRLKAIENPEKYKEKNDPKLDPSYDPNFRPSEEPDTREPKTHPEQNPDFKSKPKSKR